MKVIFVNPPFVKNSQSNASNNFTIAPSFIDKLRTPSTYRNIKGGGGYIIT